MITQNNDGTMWTRIIQGYDYEEAGIIWIHFVGDYQIGVGLRLLVLSFHLLVIHIFLCMYALKEVIFTSLLLKL